MKRWRIFRLGRSLFNHSLIVAGRRRPFLRLQGDKQDARLSDAGSVPRGPGGHGGS